jgi:hypothetical protein
METERFAVPELLFNPCDIGLNQAGIAEATWQSLSDIQNVRFETFSIVQFILFLCGLFIKNVYYSTIAYYFFTMFIFKLFPFF